MKKEQTLKEQIKSALADDTMSAAMLNELMEKIEFAIETGDRKAAQAAADALKLDTDAEQRSWELHKKQLINAAQQLEAKYEAAGDVELLAKKQARYEAVKIEYDELDAELERLYPQLAGPLFDLLSRCAQTNQHCKEVGLPGFDDHLLRDTKLFDLAGHLLWPPPQPSTAASLAMAMVPTFDPRYSANWAAAREADDKQKIKLFRGARKSGARAASAGT